MVDKEDKDIPTNKSDESSETSAQHKQVEIPRSKKRKKWPITVSIIVIVLIVAGAGFWVWHEQPSFCGAICHKPMDPYLANYEAEPGQVSFDKYGNTVSDANAMMAIAHKKDDIACIGCHIPTIEEQVTEGLHWISGDYEYPLNERSLSQLTAYRGDTADEFCLNESCHNMTRSELEATTSSFARNPHESYHLEEDCGTCHKGHRASVFYCSRCHDDAELPEGWLSWEEAEELRTI